MSHTSTQTYLESMREGLLLAMDVKDYTRATVIKNDLIQAGFYDEAVEIWDELEMKQMRAYLAWLEK